MTVKAEGSAPVAVQPTYELTDAGGEVVGEGEIAVGEAKAFELEDGSYSFELTSAPVLEDGTTYELPGEPTSIEVGEGDLDFEIELEAIAADDMTKEQLEAVAAELEDAGKSGAAATAREQAASAPSVSGSADAVKRPAPSGGSSSSSPSAGGSGSGGSSQPSQPANPGGASEPSEPSAPAHEHSWVAQTEERYVVDAAAWDEQVPYSVWKCLKCGITFSSKADAEAHFTNFALQGDLSHNGTVLTEYETVHHPEAGHWETVTVGYKCSGCGAWQ